MKQRLRVDRGGGICGCCGLRLDCRPRIHPCSTSTRTRNKAASIVLDKGEEALPARAWLTRHARQSIGVRYFIWSTDNIGILVSQALLHAAQSGIKVRGIVDDLLIDVPDKSLLALARHPNIQIRTYNPKITVGTTRPKCTLNVLSLFHGVSQRMHDKTFIVDGKAAITAGAGHP